MRRMIFATVIACAAVVATGWMLFASSPAPTIEYALQVPRYDFTSDDEYVYRVTWMSTHSGPPVLKVGAVPLVSSAMFSGTVRLRVLDRFADELRMALIVESVDAFEMSVLGDPMPASFRRGGDSANQKPMPWFEFDLHRSGGARDVRTPTGTDPSHVPVGVAAYWFLPGMFLPLEPNSGAGPWQKLEAAMLGQARSVFRAAPVDSGVEIVRERERYLSVNGASRVDDVRQAVSSSTRLHVSPDGQLVRASGAERTQFEFAKDLVLFSEMLEVVFVERRPRSSWEASDLSSLPALEAVSLVSEDDVRLTMLKQRAQALSFEHLMRDVRAVSSAGTLPDHKRWFWNAIARLELEPERLPELVELFADPGASQGRRELIADLLASTGTPEAQRELVSALKLVSTSLVDKDYVQLLQRGTFIARPSEGLRDFMLDEHAKSAESGAHAVEYGSAYSLGAIAMRTGGHHGALIIERLRGALLEATSDERQAAYLYALGNAKAVDGRPEILSLKDSSSASVRMALASGLSSSTGRDATEALIELAKESHPAVQAAALKALASHALVDSQFVQLSDALPRNLAYGNELHFVRLVAPRRVTSGAAARMLAALLVSLQGDPKRHSQVLALIN